MLDLEEEIRSLQLDSTGTSKSNVTSLMTIYVYASNVMTIYIYMQVMLGLYMYML